MVSFMHAYIIVSPLIHCYLYIDLSIYIAIERINNIYDISSRALPVGYSTIVIITNVCEIASN